MKKKLAAALLAIAMLAASLAGCSSPSSSQPAGSTSSSASTAESGEKVLTIAQGGDITTFDICRTTTTASPARCLATSATG